MFAVALVYFELCLQVDLTKITVIVKKIPFNKYDGSARASYLTMRGYITYDGLIPSSLPLPVVFCSVNTTAQDRRI